jgi:transposase-like protein
MMEMAFLISAEGLFQDRPFDPEIIVLCVRWYLRYKLSTRELDTVGEFLWTTTNH